MTVYNSNHTVVILSALSWAPKVAVGVTQTMVVMSAVSVEVFIE